MDALILISLHWDIEFHVHTNVSNLAIKLCWCKTLSKNATNQLPMHYCCSTTPNEIIPQLKEQPSRRCSLSINLLLFIRQQIYFLYGPYGIVILGSKIASFKKNNMVATFFLGI
jgi:hypothetical protein